MNTRKITHIDHLDMSDGRNEIRINFDDLTYLPLIIHNGTLAVDLITTFENAIEALEQSK